MATAFQKVKDVSMEMKLLVFCHDSVAYLIPNHLFAQIKKADIEYEKGNIDYPEILNEIKEKYQLIEVGHLLTGDLA